MIYAFKNGSKLFKNYFRGIFANSVPHTECTEVKERYGIPC
jgi:hypothetical protein